VNGRPGAARQRTSVSPWGHAGTDVARESAGLVLLDDDFASIAGGIRQGRGIFDNLRKAMSYIIAVHVPILGMSLIPVFVNHWPLVLLPGADRIPRADHRHPALLRRLESEQIDPEDHGPATAARR